MDSQTLHLSVDYVGSSGIVLNTEQKAALQNSLVILKNENKFVKVYLWGKIMGIKDDYFIAVGTGADELMERKTFYSKDCTHWGLMPLATQALKEKCRLAKGRFTGDPSYEYEHTEIKKVPGDGDEMTEEEETITIKEEDRLATVIADISEDVLIVPRSAFTKTPKGLILRNRTFEGLSVAESAKLSSYFHFRDPINLPLKTLLEKASTESAIDFLDPVDEDIPKGCWSLQFERGSALVILRSLIWQGYTFYQVPGTKEYGSIYCGTGEKNRDLPFML